MYFLADLTYIKSLWASNLNSEFLISSDNLMIKFSDYISYLFVSSESYTLNFCLRILLFFFFFGYEVFCYDI